MQCGYGRGVLLWCGCDETKTNRGVYNNTHLFPKFLCIITLKMSHKVLPEEVWGGLLPKKETQSFEFVQNHPEWDGRGIVVGILDTGVDPGAIGLQQTTDGKPKVIDIIDCSGSGDVVMHGPFQVDVEGVLPGIGGQKLKVNPSWNNPSGNYRVGIKVHRQ
jgi:tripeptidyl-peptidase II